MISLQPHDRPSRPTRSAIPAFLDTDPQEAGIRSGSAGSYDAARYASIRSTIVAIP